METYKLVNGNIITETTVGAKNPAVKLIKAEIEDLKIKKNDVQTRVDELEAKKTDIQSRIDTLKAFLVSIGE